MKEKIITIKPKDINQKQWSIFLLELNLMKRAWKSYGVKVLWSKCRNICTRFKKNNRLGNKTIWI
jgi:hypothetical protein